MRLLQRAEDQGWSLISPNRQTEPSGAANAGNVVQQAKAFLGQIDQALVHSFSASAQRENAANEEHFLGAIARWLDEKGVTAQGFPAEESVEGVPRTRVLKDVHVGGGLQTPYFLQRSRYTTKSGKKGYAFVAQMVESGVSREDLAFGEVVVAYRVEEKVPGMWTEYSVDPDPQYKLGFLAEIAESIYDYYALVIPNEPTYRPRGGGEMMRRAA